MITKTCQPQQMESTSGRQNKNGIAYSGREALSTEFCVDSSHAGAIEHGYGHAKDFFDPTLSDGSPNTKRAMLQFQNGSAAQPQAEDLLVFAPTLFNRSRHVAIIASVGSDTLEIAQQNPGPFGRPREKMALTQREGRWYIGQANVLGGLRLTPADAPPAPEQSYSRNQ